MGVHFRTLTRGRRENFSRLRWVHSKSPHVKLTVNQDLLCLYGRGLFYCALQLLRFLQIEGLWQPCLRRAVFATAFAYFVLLCHILIILAIF